MSNGTSTDLTPLPRAVLHIVGPDAAAFLQGLVSNDITLLQSRPAIYACLLSPQGKFLHDMFIINGLNGDFYIDCEGGNRVHDLIQRLTTYRLRRKITMTHLTNASVAAGRDEPSDNVILYPDTRDDRMGWRTLFLTPPATPPTGAFDNWDQMRLKCAIPDGARDAEVGISTLEELNIPRLSGVSFTKGCYVGQELTARMENRGLGKRHLHPVILRGAATTPDIQKNGNIIGTLRSSNGPYGLALIRDDIIKSVHETPAEIVLTADDGADFWSL